MTDETPTPADDYSPADTASTRGLVDSGQYRIELVQLLNWGSYHNLCTMPVGRGGIAILGPTGRGKSTVLDAMSAVVMPNPQEFNRAARDDSRQRSERTVYSYARGKTDEIRNADSDSTTTKFLRPLGQQFASGAAITWRNDLGETITGVRLAWIGCDTSTQDEVTASTVYLLVRGEFPLTRLAELRQDGVSGSPLSKSSLGRILDPTRDLITYSQPQYRVALCDKLEIGGDDESQLKALTLLRRAQASKGIFSVGDLFKQFVLTKPGALSRWETTLGTYREASALYDVFETTRKKLEILEKVPFHAERYAAAQSDAAQKRRLLVPTEGERHSRLKVWHADKINGWAADRVDEILIAKREQEQIVRGFANQEAEAQRASTAAMDRIVDLGGDPSQRLRVEIDAARQELTRIERLTSQLRTPLDQAGLTLPTTESEMTVLRERASTVRSERADSKKANDAEKVEISGRIVETRKAREAAAREKTHFELRGGNVPSDADERRARIAAGTGLAREELPYLGELIEVAPENREWSKAVDRVLGETATHLVVDESHFDEVRRFVNDNDMRGRIVVVPARAQASAERDPIPQTVPALLRFAETSPFRFWLHDLLVTERSVLCVDSPDDFDAQRPAGTSGAVTRTGLQTASRGRIVKDDRRRDSWIGLDNSARVSELQERIAQLEALLVDEQQAYDAVDRREEAEKGLLQVLERLAEIEWPELDRAPVESRIADLLSASEKVATDHPEIAELQTERERADAARLLATEQRVTAQARREELQTEYDALVDIEDGVSDALSDSSPLNPEERLLLAELPMTAPGSRDDIARLLDAAKKLLHEQIDAHEQSAEQAKDTLEATFLRYLDADRNAGIDGTIDSLPAVLAIQRTLVEDDLPRAKDDWLAQAGTNMGDSLRALLTQIDEDGRAIQRGVRPISAALAGIEFREGSTLTIEPRHVTNADLNEFRRTLKRHTTNSVGSAPRDASTIERDFLALRADLALLEEQSKAGEAWRRRVLDVREHYQFRAIETRVDGTEVVHEGVAGKSGGEGQELIAFVLGAALRYRLGDGTDRVPTYAPIILDEGFVKADNEYTGRALSALRSLGFQLLVGAPRDKVNAFEDHVDSVAYISGDPAHPEYSRIYSLGIAEALNYDLDELEALDPGELDAVIAE